MTFNLEKAIRAREEYLAKLTPEERKKVLEKEEVELKDADKKFRKLLQELIENNKHHERALKVLDERIKDVINDPEMTPEVKEFAETICLLISQRMPFRYDYYGFFESIIEQERNEGVVIYKKNISDERHKEDRAMSAQIPSLWKKYKDRGLSKNNASTRIAKEIGLAKSTVREKLKGL